MHQKKTKVLIDTFHLLNAFSGIRTYTTQLCKGIEKATDLNAEYIILPDWKKLDGSSFLKGRLGLIKKIINHISYLLWKQAIIPLIIWYRKIDVVLCTDFVLPILSGRAKGLVVIHDTLYWEFTSNYNPLWRKYFLWSVDRGLKKNSIIIATSHYTKERIKKIISDKHTVEVVYQSPNVLNIENSNLNVIDKYNLDNIQYFIHVGTFDKRKNLLLLINAFNHFINENKKDNFKLVLVGGRAVGAHHDDYQNIQNLISSLQLNDKIAITGFVGTIELATLYSNAFAYIFPSLEEGFGIPILEAMSVNIPVIISNRGSLKEIAGNSALIFDAEDALDLANKMVEIINPDLRLELIKKGKERLKLFSRDKFVSAIDTIIHNYTSTK